MKLEKITHIKDYKSYSSFDWQKIMPQQEKLHSKMNLFFGENGSGKSSISTILKSITRQFEFAENIPEEAELQFDTKGYTFSNSLWNETLDSHSILFFDRDFIKKNIHLGFERTRDKFGQEQESGKLIIEFDQEAISKRNILKEKEEKKNELDKKLKEFKNENSKALQFELDEKEKSMFEELKDKNQDEINIYLKGLEEEVAKKNEQIKSDSESLKKVSEIQSIEKVSYEKIFLKLSGIDTYKELFYFSIKDKADQISDEKLKAKIKSNKDFFEKGIQLRKTYTESCPFCEATNREDEISNIINAYKSIYDDSYNKSVSLFNEKKKSIIEEVELLLKNVQKNYSQIFLKLKEYQEKFHIPSIYSIEEEKNIKSVDLSFLNAFLNTIKNLSSPSKLAIEDDYSKIKQFIENQQKAFDDLYGLFDEKNAIINKFKNENTDTLIKDRLESNQRLISSKTHSINFIQEGKIEKQREKEDRELQLKKIEREIQSIKQDVTEVKKEFEEYVSTEAFKKTLERIQYYFEKFNFGFKLELDTSKPKGAATKEVTFSFKVLDKDDNPRSFNEGLSEGQLHVLSICFFLAFIDIQDRKEEKIIVFDDPINSLDNSNIGFFVDILFDKKDEISQLLVLTHHKTFYKFIQKKFKTSDGLNSFGNEYLIIRNEKRYGGSFIVKSQRDSLKDKLKKFIDNPIPAQQIPYIDIESRIIEHGQYLRYELERFVKNDLLQWNQDKFPTLVSGITTNRFLEDNDLESLKKVYQFCNWTTSHVDHGDDHGLEQLKIYIKLFLEVMERFHIAKNNSTNSNNQP